MLLATSLLIAALAQLPAAAAGEVLSAEDALARQAGRMKVVPFSACDKTEDPAEVLVCGRRRSASYRLPLPVEPVPGARSADQMTDQRTIMAMNPKPCPPRPRGRQSEGVDLLAVAATVAAVAVNLANPEEQPIKTKRETSCG